MNESNSRVFVFHYEPRGDFFWGRGASTASTINRKNTKSDILVFSTLTNTFFSSEVFNLHNVKYASEGMKTLNHILPSFTFA